MREAGLDCLVATDPQNVAYLCDYYCESSRVMRGVQVYGLQAADEAGGPGLVVPSLEVDSWAEQPGQVHDVTAYGTFHRTIGRAPLDPAERRLVDVALRPSLAGDAVEALVAALRARGVASGAIGVDESNLTPVLWSRIAERLPQARIVAAARLFATIRMVKTGEELARMRRSAQITEEAMRRTWSELTEGMSERELAGRFRIHVTELGGDPAFWIVNVGRRTARTHSRLSDAVVRRGDLIKMDVGCRYGWYWSDVGRTKTFGPAAEDHRRLYGALREGTLAAIRAVRPGVRASELFATAVGAVRAAGIPTYERHHTGHGIGIAVYDPPIVQPAHLGNIFGIDAEDPPLEIGTTLNIETPHYVLGECGFIVEDTMVIGEHGAEMLTTLDYELELA